MKINQSARTKAAAARRKAAEPRKTAAKKSAVPARGGKRAGAGRKPGSLAGKTRKIAEQAVREGITPLEVMIEAMRKHIAGNRWDCAAAIAKDAAPYVHPKLSAIEHTGQDGGPVAIERIERVIVDPQNPDA